MTSIPGDRAATPFRLGHLAALNGLRGCAVLAVMVVHAASRYLPGGFIGVDVFFVLSGFLITSLLLQEWDRTGGISLPKFYARRALRLLPALVILLCVYVVAAFVLFPRIFPQKPLYHVVDAAIVLFYASNWTNALGLERPLVLGHAWSLSVEEQFYLLWPLGVILVLRFLPSRRWLAAIALGAAALSCAHRVLMLLAGATVSRLHLGLDTRLDPLMIGSALGVALSSGLLPTTKGMERFAAAAAYGGSAGLVALACVAHWEQPATFYFFLSLVAVFSAAVILGLVSSRQSALSRILSFAPLAWVGQISYGLYLWHYPIFRVMQELGLKGPEVLPAGGVLTFAVAALSYYVVEKPLLRLKPYPGVGRPEAEPIEPLAA